MLGNERGKRKKEKETGEGREIMSQRMAYMQGNVSLSLFLNKI